MKRHGNLFEKLVSWPNLLAACRLASRGKRYRDNVARFQFDYETELLRLQRELQNRRYEPGAYHTFYIEQPKRRLISAAPFRDRVVHHALCNVIEPIFERRFIAGSFACRKGKGTHATARLGTSPSGCSASTRSDVLGLRLIRCRTRRAFPAKNEFDNLLLDLEAAGCPVNSPPASWWWLEQQFEELSFREP